MLCWIWDSEVFIFTEFRDFIQSVNKLFHKDVESYSLSTWGRMHFQNTLTAKSICMVQEQFWTAQIAVEVYKHKGYT